MTDHRTLPRLALALFLFTWAVSASAGERWSVQRANDWSTQQPWLVGCNYTPRTAINQLEFWQGETFDPKTIDEELGWAHDVGFNTLRVYLHHLPYQRDAEGFTKRIDQFLGIADEHGIRVMFVLLDDCWDPNPRPGRQREPKPHLHNSGWVQSPGADILAKPERHDQMKPYVAGVIGRFRNDRRVLAWDLYNEPGNDNSSKYPGQEPPNKHKLSLLLLRKAFDWALEIRPDQPITVGLWVGDWSDPEKTSPINSVCIERSDIMTFHSYSAPAGFKARAAATLKLGRPVICTEYLNRPGGCTYEALLPYMKERQIGAINWGFVAGKIQTQYPWASWRETFTDEPEIWFHDVLRPNGTPFDSDEVELIRALTGRGVDRCNRAP
ncbi:MAG: cellulase family glycosylhydrolase [Planctomycetes bacterium]|nr:cellulase family glycosylhydrolase [Planctomycetota bacterium]